MKKIFFKKCVSLLLLLFLLAPSTSLAESGENYYRTEKENKNINLTTNIVTKVGSSTIINRSDKDFFVPNKTTSEYTSWYENAPNYVSVSVCGSGGCEEGEDIYSCPADCSSPKYCGDGICSQTTVKYSSTTPLATIPASVCPNKNKGWLAVAAGVLIGGVITVATGGVGIGIAAGIVAGSVTGILLPDNITCGQPVPIYSLSVKEGEVYSVDTGTTYNYSGKLYEAPGGSQYAYQTECKADCAPPSGYGCGPCGYDSDNNLCPNYCSNRGYNTLNCKLYPAVPVFPNENGTLQSIVKRQGLKEYLTATEALAIEQQPASNYEEGYYYYDSPYYGCDFGANESTYYCVAGTYCPHTGGMKTGTAVTSYVTTTWLNSQSLTMTDLQPKTCPAGYFCPAGSFYPRPCPINTFSTGGAGKCTACMPGTSTGGVSKVDSESLCKPAYKSRDGICNITDSVKETPTNSAFDCPDSSHIDMFKGDGRCSGVETASSSPADCKCGNGKCDNSETYLSCLPDCGCQDSVCGTVSYSSNWTKTVFPETKWCNSYGATTTNKSICKHMNEGEVCGNDVCEPGEEYRNIQDLDGVYRNKIVCPLDCSCGNGYCQADKGENMTSCYTDCKCGNGVCDSNESSSSCIADCHCGNNKCEENYSENAYNCSGDCRCGDNICSAGETDCTSDCGYGEGICGDGVCAYMEMGFGKRVKETLANCPEDCAGGYTLE